MSNSRFFMDKQRPMPSTQAAQEDTHSIPEEARQEKSDLAYRKLFSCIFNNLSDQPGQLYESCSQEFNSYLHIHRK
jgi:hypothetical protein